MKDFARLPSHTCLCPLIEMGVRETQRHVFYMWKYPQEMQRHFTSLSGGFVLLLELRKKPLQAHKWMLIGGFGHQWSTHALIWSFPSNMQRYSKVNIVYFWTLLHFSLRPQSFKRLFYLSLLHIICRHVYWHNLQAPALYSLEFLQYLIGRA